MSNITPGAIVNPADETAFLSNFVKLDRRANTFRNSSAIADAAPDSMPALAWLNHPSAEILGEF